LLAEEDVFSYVYDFGDNWKHEIIVESVIDNAQPDLHGGAFVTGGEVACPAEEAGETEGYQDFLETLLVVCQ